jgi:hypothetical protein
MKYNVLELCTAVKPYLLKYLFEKYDAEKILYLDPDIVVYHTLDTVLELLERCTAILTPHIVEPLPSIRLWCETGKNAVVVRDDH